MIGPNRIVATRVGTLPKGKDKKAPEGAACVLVGGKRPIDCMNESGGKHCVCLTLQNKCSYTVQVHWKVTSQKEGLSDYVRPGKTYTEACTGHRDASITYVGHTKAK
jgi:hypothetical protein